MTLEIIAGIVVVVAIVGAVLAARGAPAVSIALVGGLLGAVIADVRTSGPHGVPASVALGASAGIVLGGLLGLVVSRRRASATWPMRRDALWLLAFTPIAAGTLLLAILNACPLYVTQDAGMCFYDVDVLGGWAAGVVFLFCVDMVMLVALLWLSPGPRTGT
jgi:hypothetical protein